MPVRRRRRTAYEVARDGQIADLTRYLNNVYRNYRGQISFTGKTAEELAQIKRQGYIDVGAERIYPDDFDPDFSPGRGRPLGSRNKPKNEFDARFGSLLRNAGTYPTSKRYNIYVLKDSEWERRNENLLTALEAYNRLKFLQDSYNYSPNYMRYEFVNTPETEHAVEKENGAKSEHGLTREELINILSQEMPARLKEFTKLSIDELIRARDQAIAAIPKKIRVIIEAPKRRIILPEDEIEHRRFPLLIALLERNVNILLVGPAGTGKTKSAHNAAMQLERTCYPMSVGNQTSKGDILGFIHAGGEYITSAPREAYENRNAILLCDEFDAGNANALTLLNQMLANDFAGFPDMPEGIRRAKNTCVIATANTYGTGGNRLYARNQLDAATLDRFFILDWPHDSILESYLCGITVEPQYELPEPSGLSEENILQIVQEVRSIIEQDNIPHIVSMRSSITAIRLKDVMPKQILLEGILWRGMQQTYRAQIMNKLTESTKELIQ